MRFEWGRFVGECASAEHAHCVSNVFASVVRTQPVFLSFCVKVSGESIRGRLRRGGPSPRRRAYQRATVNDRAYFSMVPDLSIRRVHVLTSIQGSTFPTGRAISNQLDCEGALKDVSSSVRLHRARAYRRPSETLSQRDQVRVRCPGS